MAWLLSTPSSSHGTYYISITGSHNYRKYLITLALINNPKSKHSSWLSNGKKSHFKFSSAQFAFPLSPPLSSIIHHHPFACHSLCTQLTGQLRSSSPSPSLRGLFNPSTVQLSVILSISLLYIACLINNCPSFNAFST